MPDTDGFALARQIVADPRHAGIKVIMILPAGAPPRPQRRQADRVIAAQLTKPLRQSELLAALLAAVTPSATIAAAGVAASPAAVPTAAPAQRRLDVLVVEDNVTNRTVITMCSSSAVIG